MNSEQNATPIDDQLIIITAIARAAGYDDGAAWIEQQATEFVERELAEVSEARLCVPASVYPCSRCGKPRTKAQGGTIFTVCDDCWNANAGESVAPRVIDGKFRAEVRDGRVVIAKTSSGEIVPEDEPLVLMRGRDHLMLPTLGYYRERCRLDGCNDYQLGLTDELITKFVAYASDPSRMKQPGITRGAAWNPDDAPPPEPSNTPHVYLSTACHHSKHSECRKECKFCQATCGCACHRNYGAEVAPPTEPRERRLRAILVAWITSGLLLAGKGKDVSK